MDPINVLESLKLDPKLLMAIVGISEYIKSFDKTEKYKKIYFLFPIILSIIVGLVISEGLKETVLNSFVYLGISVLFYEVIWKFAKSLIDKMSPKP